MEAIEMNGRSVSLRELLLYGRLSGTLPAVQRFADDAAIELWAEQLGVQAETEDLQRELTTFRKEHGLFSAASARVWLEERGAELGDLVAMLRPRVLRRLLEGRVVEKDAVERYFAENRMAYDLAQLSILVVREYGEAQELRFRLEEGADFHALARTYSTDENSRPAGGYVGWKGREELNPLTAAAVFGAKNEEVLGPFETDQGHWLVKVESLRMAELDEQTTADIRERLFEEAFEKFRQTLDIRETIWRLEG